MHHNVKDLTGHRVGRWTVISYLGASYWLCRCECGNERRVFTGNLHGKSLSCGCLASEWATQHKTTHGMCGTAEYKTWAGIKRRCFNKNDASFRAYGAKGINMCDRWANSFELFLEDMGERPSEKHTIDRIDNAKGYEPGNCRWATMFDQANNTRKNRFLEYNGERKTLSQWARILGCNPSTLWWRANKGWPAEKILTLPIFVGRNCS